MSQGKLDEAKPEAEWALAVARRRLPPEDLQLGKTLVIMGNIVFRQGRYEEALAAFRESLDVATKASGPQTPAAAEPLVDIATTLSRLGKSAEALSYADRGLELVERDLPDDHPALGMHFDLRAAILEDLGRHEEARRDARRAVAIVEKSFGRESPFMVSSLTTLGNASLALGDMKTGLAELERATALCGTDCAKIDRADVTFSLAKALRRAGRQPKRALALADEAAESYRALGDPRAESVQTWRRVR
jgi:eukaryotic-like serine/threonine-protein kinase